MKEFMNYDFNINKIVLACFVPAGTGDAVHRNRPSHGLALHLNGNKIYSFSDGKELAVKAGDIIYLPKNSNYTVYAKEKGNCYAINFDIDENKAFSPFVVNIKNLSTVTDYFKSAQSTWQKKKNSYITKCKAELYSIIYTMQREYFSEYFPKNKLEIITPAVDYIHEKYTNELISIDTLSKMCGITPEYFRRIFKSFYGISPLNYINNLKITRAKELLESQMYSVTEAALLSGYTEMSHFSREFKKSTGISPLNFKNTSKKGTS